MIAFQLFQQIAGLFFMIGLGFLLVKMGILQSEDSRVLSRVCIYIIMPCVNINAFLIDYTPEIMRGFLTGIVIAVLWHFFLLLILPAVSKVIPLSSVERMSIMYTNAGNLVIPLVTALFGKEWVIYASAYICVQTIFVWSHGQSVMSGQTSFNWKRIVTNVNMISAAAGVFLFLGHIRLPEIIGGVIGSLASTIGPICMIMIGMLIGGTNLKEAFSQKRVYKVVFMRLVVFSLLAVSFVRIAGNFVQLENEQTILMISLLGMITPAAATVTQLAQFYDNETEYCSTIIVVSTLLCIVTMPAMIALFTI